MNVGSNSVGNHLVDIHEVLHEEEEDKEENGNISTMTDKPDTKSNRPSKNREMKRPPRKFSRQVSLETGFSVLNGETSKDKNERKVLERSGNSFGGFSVNGTTGVEARNKGDFNMFRTKSTISRQSSKIPLRKESGIELQNNNAKGGLDDYVKKSVPAGRYFDALTGPELDQVKVIYRILRTFFFQKMKNGLFYSGSQLVALVSALALVVKQSSGVLLL